MLFLSICVLLKIFSSIFSTHFSFSCGGCQCVAWSRCEFSPEPHAALWCYATGRIRMAHRTGTSIAVSVSFFFKDFDFKALFISQSFCVCVPMCNGQSQAERKETRKCAMDSPMCNGQSSWKPGNVHRFLLDHPCLILVYRSLSWVSILIEPVGWP